MDYIYGKLCQRVKEVQYSGGITDTIQVNVDQDTNVITADYIGEQSDVTKEYVDEQIAGLSTKYLSLNGGTMSGALDMNDNSITNIPEPTRDGDAANKEYVDRHNPDARRQGNWSYKVFPDGTFEAWYKATDQRMEILEQSGNTYRSALQTMTLPTNLTDGKTCEIIDCYVNCGHNSYPVWGVIASIQAPGYPYSVNWYAISGNSRSLARNYYITCFIMGTIT